jgi:peptide deformylase
MALYPIVKYPDPVLLRPTEELADIGDRERVLVRDMIETMHHEHGVGLAANQIGIPKRIFVASPDGKKGKELVFFNPRIVRASGAVREDEGCLSIPGFYDAVKRRERVTLRARGLDGRPVEIEAEGLLARIFQHETDHLDGFLFIHRLGFFRKRSVLRRLGERLPSPA